MDGSKCSSSFDVTGGYRRQGSDESGKGQKRVKVELLGPH
jgi:hypothetical protein